MFLKEEHISNLCISSMLLYCLLLLMFQTNSIWIV